jgi:hypothetical protein
VRENRQLLRDALATRVSKPEEFEKLRDTAQSLTTGENSAKND